MPDVIQYEWQEQYYLQLTATDNLAVLKDIKYTKENFYSLYLDTSVTDGISVKDYICKLLSKQGLKAAATGGAVLGVAKGIEHILPKIDPNQKFGTAIANIDSGVAKLVGREINVDDPSSAVTWAKQNGYVQ